MCEHVSTIILNLLHSRSLISCCGNPLTETCYQVADLMVSLMASGVAHGVDIYHAGAVVLDMDDQRVADILVALLSQTEVAAKHLLADEANLVENRTHEAHALAVDNHAAFCMDLRYFVALYYCVLWHAQ